MFSHTEDASPVCVDPATPCRDSWADIGSLHRRCATSPTKCRQPYTPTTTVTISSRRNVRFFTLDHISLGHPRFYFALRSAGRRLQLNVITPYLRCHVPQARVASETAFTPENLHDNRTEVRRCMRGRSFRMEYPAHTREIRGVTRSREASFTGSRNVEAS